MSGWIRLQRGTLTHSVFDRTPFSEAEAWIWLIENAAYENTKHRVGNTIEKVDRGSMFCTLRGLAKAWKWRSDHRVRKFLEILESEKMILKCNRTKKTQLTICNYSTYQDDGRNGGATGAQRGRTKVTNKQINNTTLLGAREFELYEAANNEDPRLALNLSEPLNWLSNGCDFDLDIIPGIKHMATKNKVTNWSYCRGRVFQNRDTRLAPAPKPIVNGTGNRNFSTKADRNKEAVAKAREWFNEMQGNPHQSEMKAIN